METESWIPRIAIAIGFALMACGLAFAYRRPRDYGPGEIARRPDNATVTTIARNDLHIAIFVLREWRTAGRQATQSHRFGPKRHIDLVLREWRAGCQSQVLGTGLTGIALKLDGDETEYLFTSSNDWYKETRHKLKRDIRLMLLADGAPVVEAQRLPEALDGWQKDRSGKYTKLYDIDCAAGHFELVRIGPAQFALRHGETILGIIAMPLPTGVFSPLRTRIELPARLSLAIRLFLALLVDVEDRNRGDSSST